MSAVNLYGMHYNVVPCEFAFMSRPPERVGDDVEILTSGNVYTLCYLEDSDGNGYLVDKKARAAIAWQCEGHDNGGKG